LHLTFFFGGQVLCSLPTDELVKWHSDIQTTIDHRTNALESQSTHETYMVSFRRLRLFPPGINSLVVAELDVSPSLQRLYEDIVGVTLSRETTNNMLAQLVKRQHYDKWLAHVTLADIPRCWGKRELGKLETVLQNTRSNLSSPVHGLTMGGPYPEQADLDWNFYLPPFVHG
jgi:hypothetical protein